MADITKPILLDETGQEIKNALFEIRDAVQNQSGGGGGSDGFSPVAKVTQTEAGAVITITDKTGTTTATVNHGEKGDKGDTGADGKTPVKYVDYFTEADIQEMVLAVLAALPNGDGVSY